MTDNLLKSKDSFYDRKKEYFTYKLTASQKFMRFFCLLLALFNGVLLIPDLKLVDNAFANILIVILRIIFSLLLVGLYLEIQRIKTFRVFSCIVTAFELYAVFIFLFVLSRYDPPDFMIQALGIIIINIAIFLTPNRWVNMLAASIINAIGFLVYSFYFISDISTMQFAAVTVYIAISIILCAIFAWETQRHQYREFIATYDLKRMSMIDQLTQAANRYKLIEESEKWMAFCRRNDFPLSLVLIDVDDLKLLNDLHGHNFGDFVLVNLVKLIDTQLRSTDVLARWGGDEFVMLLPNIDAKSAIILSERIGNTIAESKFESDVKMTCTFGIIEMHGKAGIDELIKEADDLMYAGKKLGKNRVISKYNMEHFPDTQGNCTKGVTNL